MSVTMGNEKYNEMLKTIDDLQAKLDKAVEALERLSVYKFMNGEHVAKFANETLKEIKDA